MDVETIRDSLPALFDGLWLTVEITAVKGPMVTFTVSGRDAAGDAIVKGTHMRFASPVAKTAERLRANPLGIYVNAISWSREMSQ